MKNIDIGGVLIPLDNYVIGGTALLGIRDSGKTYAAKGIAEQLLHYKIPLVIFDAIGVWRYLKVAGAGVHGGQGFKVVVAGGKAADLPLTPASAPEIVRAAIRENIPLIIDLYDEKLSKADWRRIVQKCFRTLLYENVGLRHIFLEEAAEYAPQKVFDGETYAEVEKLVRMGGNKSLGITLINQRAQELNKAVLDLCENLVLMRQRGAHAIGALEKWIDKLEPDVAKQIAREMPHMEQGDAWVFTGAADKARRVHTAKIRSYHPDRRKPQSAREAGRSADTAEFVSRMSGELAAVIKAAEIDDPKKLRARIAELERAASKRGGKQEVDPAAVKTAYQRGLVDGQRYRLKDRDSEHKDLRLAMRLAVNQAIETTMNEHAPQRFKVDGIRTDLATLVVEATVRDSRKPSAPVREIIQHTSNGETPPSVRKILDTIHRSYPVWLTFDAAARRAGISSRSSAYRKYRKLIAGSAELEREGDRYRSLAEFAQSGGISTGASISDWAARLPPTYGKMLMAVYQHGPLDRSAIAEHAGVSPTSSGLGSGLRELVRQGLVTHSGGQYFIGDGLE